MTGHQQLGQVTEISWEAAIAEHEAIGMALLLVPPLRWIPKEIPRLPKKSANYSEVLYLRTQMIEAAQWLVNQVNSTIGRMATAVRDMGYVAAIAHPAKFAVAQSGTGGFFPLSDVWGATKAYEEWKEKERNARISQMPMTALLPKYEGMIALTMPYGNWGRHVPLPPDEASRLGMPTLTSNIVRWATWAITTERFYSLREQKRKQKNTFTETLSDYENLLARNLGMPAKWRHIDDGLKELMHMLINRCCYLFESILVLPERAARLAAQVAGKRKVLTIKEVNSLWDGKLPNGEWRNALEDED